MQSDNISGDRERRMNYSQTKWSVPLKIALMNWLFETWTRLSLF